MIGGSQELPTSDLEMVDQYPSDSVDLAMSSVSFPGQTLENDDECAINQEELRLCTYV